MPIYSDIMLTWPVKEVKLLLSTAETKSVQGMLALHVKNWDAICCLEIDSCVML